MQRNTVTKPDVEVRDYLAPLSDVQRARRYRRKQQALKVGCSHDRLRQFIFSDGKTIKMCPDCDTFNAKRHRVLCKGQALKDCAATTKAVKTLNPIHVKKRDRPQHYMGMAHIVSSSKHILTYRWVVDVTVVPNRMRRKQTPAGICALPKVVPQPIKPSVAYEYTVVVPLACTRVVKDIPDWNKFYTTLVDHHRLACLYEGDYHIPERTAPFQVPPTTSGPACMWLWPGFVDKTKRKTVSKRHTIGGRWCKCSECREQRRKR